MIETPTAGSYKVEVLYDWNHTLAIKDEWSTLNMKSGVPHPFTTYEWFECWYRAFCNPEDVRIILVKNKNNNLRAIFPGMVAQRQKGGIPLRCFSYAGNGHSPKYGIISQKSDTEAIKNAFSAIWKCLHEKIDIAIIESVDHDSTTYDVLTHLELPFLSLRVEYSFESPAFSLPEGWNGYLKKRSKNFRAQVHRGIKRSKPLGGLKYDIITDADRLEQALERLKILDSKTWQHENGTGLFSTDANKEFYTNLIKTFGIKGSMVLCFVQLERNDISFSLAAIEKNTGYLMKVGYDPDYKKFSPGFFSDYYLSEWMSSSGLTEIDMLGDMDDYKKPWETHRRRYSNCWLVNKKSIRGKLLLLEILTYNYFKKNVLRKTKGLFKTQGDTEKSTQEMTSKA